MRRKKWIHLFMSTWMAISLLTGSLVPVTTASAAGASFNVLTGAANPLDAFGAAVGGSGGNNKFIAADFEGDGYTDLINRNSTNTGVQYWRNNGNGSFTELTGSNNPFRNITLAGTAASYFTALYLTVGDFDGDGDVDVFNANHRTSAETAAPALYRNDGGTFTVLQGAGSNPLHAFGTAVGTNSSKTIAADFDDDGDTDLVNRNSTSNGVQYWRNNGNGTFTELTGTNNPLGSVTFTANASYFNTTSIAVGDFDGDGDIDIFNANHEGSPGMYRNDGSSFTVLQGAGTNPLHAFGTAVGSIAGNFVAGDFDGDGLVDLANRNSSNTGVQFWKNNGDGTFTEQKDSDNPFRNVTYPGTTVNHFFKGFLGVGDFDGDGDTDIVNNNHGGSPALYRQAGSPPALDSSVPSDNAASVVPDNRIQLIFNETIASAGSGTVELHKSIDGSLVESIAGNSTNVTGFGTNVITVNYSASLQELTDYYVLINKRAFFDSDGQTYAGISNKTGLNFTVVAQMQNSSLYPSTASFNRNPASPGYADVTVELTLNGNNLTDILLGGTVIGSGNYTVSGSSVTIKKEYLATLGNGEHVLTFDMNAGTDPALTITVSDAAVVAYPSRPGVPASSSYTLSVNGQPVFVEKFGDISFARFSYSGTANLNLTANGTVTSYEISPKSYQIQGISNGNSLSFSITQPKTLIVTVNNLEKLFLFADALETGAPGINDANVINLADYLPANRGPEDVVTGYFQQAIDATSALNNGTGGVLYVPDGKYMTAQLKLKSNVHLYLQSGAWIKAVPEFNSTNYPLQHGSDSSFIFIGNASHVKISGRGIIDGNGYAARTLNDRANIKLLRTAGAIDLQVQDVYFLDSARWTLHLLYAQDVVMQNFKIINDLRGAPDPASPGVLIPTVTNTDGIDIDASQNVTVEGAFIYTGDDAFTPKVTNYMNLQKPTKGLELRNNIIWTLKAAFKIGDETLMDLSDILFENNDIVYSDRFAAVWAGDEGRISNINLVNNRAEFIGGNYNERFFYYRIQLRTPDSKPGLIDNVHVKDFYALSGAKQSSSIAGYDASHRITNLSFEHIMINGIEAADKTDIPLDFRNTFYDNVIFKPSGRVYSGSQPVTVITTPANFSSTAQIKPTISGTTVAGSTVSITIDNEPPQTVVADTNGKWSYTPSVALNEGMHTVKAKAVDPSGNPVQESGVFTFTVDLTAPAAPFIQSPADNSHTFNPNPIIKGTAEAKTIVSVYIDGELSGTATADINGSWSFTPSEALTVGSHTIKARAADPAGNVSVDSAVSSFTVDLAVPIKTTFVEAEAMTLVNYVIDSNNYTPASGNQVIRVSGTGTASARLDGGDGIYDLKVHYFDENDGKATYKLYVNETQVDAWTADKDLGSASVADVTKTYRLVSGLQLKRWDEIKLEGKSETSEAARVDRLEFILLAESEVPGSISGTVVDAQGDPVAGVQVQAARNGVSPADVYQAYTDSTGQYTVSHTPAGTYTVTMHKEGFADNTVTGIAVADTPVSGINLILQSAAPPVLNTVQISGTIPALTVGSPGYDLSGLTVTGKDQYGKAFNLTGSVSNWTVKTGAGFASIMNTILNPLAAGTGTVVVTIGGKESNPLAFTVLSVEAATPRVLQVDRRGLTSGAYMSINEAIASTPALKPGDIISLVPGSGPYHETVRLHVSGLPGKPIIFDGNGELIDGFVPFQFTQEADGKWTYTLPAPIPVTTAGNSGTFRHLITYNDQRLLLDQAYGQNAGIFTSDYAALSPDGSKLILNPDLASPSSGWKISELHNGVEVVDPNSYQTYRNLRVTGVQNDAFNVHGTGTELRFENIEAFNNFDEGFSSHDSTISTIDGGVFWQNENGIYTQSSSNIVFTANNVKMYNNIGFGLATQTGTNSFSNIESWDNGISNIRLGGTVDTVNVVTYESRWSQRPWVGYQETQDYRYNVEIKPYAYSERSPITKTGAAVTVLPADKLPRFMGAFDDWRHIYFTAVEQGDVSISGPDADPDGDALTNIAEYQEGTNPRLMNTLDLTPPAPPVIVTPGNQVITNDTTPAYRGTAEANSTVTIIVDAALAGTAIADAGGNWSFTPSAVLANGQHSVKATAMDTSGNVSEESTTVSFTVDSTFVPVPIKITTVEAEAMTLNEYLVESTTYAPASGGRVIKVSGTGTASVQLEGEDGTYDLKVQYFDENDGAASYRVLINGTQVDDWSANQDLGSGSVSGKSKTSRVISGVQLKRWDTVTLEGTSNASEAARIDKLDLMLIEVSNVPGSIAGTVTNNQGFAMSGVLVQAVRDDGSSPQHLYQAYTDSQGHYMITHVPSGTYTVTVSKAGFLDRSVLGITVSNTVAADVNLTMQPAAVPYLDTVLVSGTIPALYIGEADYNLGVLNVTGKDQFGNPYDLSGLTMSWVLKTGSEYASLNGNALVPVAAGTGTVAAAIGGKESSPLSFTVQSPRVLLVDRRGITSGAYLSIAEAVASTPALKPGDTISIVQGSGPYHETIRMHTSGIAGKPIIFEGNGELISGFTPFQFTQEATGQWTYTLPAPIPFTTPGNSSTFRHLVTYNGQRLLLDQAYGQNAGIFTSEYATLSSDGTKLILNPDKASPTTGWEISTLTNGVEIEAPDSYQTYRNVRVTGFQNDAFNIHGTGTGLRFENIEAFNNFDEGFSSHDSTNSTIDGGVFRDNENGIYNMASETITFTANNVKVYNNIGYGIGTQKGNNSFTNAQVWDNGISNIRVGGTVHTVNVVTYNSRWSQRPWVGYQESQNYKYNQQIVPYAYSEYVKSDYPIIKSGTPPTVLPATQLPRFTGSFDDWRHIYFTMAEHSNLSVSGPDADPDGDGFPNRTEYESGYNPKVKDEASINLSGINNQTLGKNASTGTLSFTVSGHEGSADRLEVRKFSSNTTLIPLEGIVLGGSGADRTVRITPAAEQAGTATVTLTVYDEQKMWASGSFTVTVSTGTGTSNRKPTADPIASFIIDEDTVFTGRIHVTDADNDVLTYKPVQNPVKGTVSLVY